MCLKERGVLRAQSFPKHARRSDQVSLSDTECLDMEGCVYAPLAQHASNISAGLCSLCTQPGATRESGHAEDENSVTALSQKAYLIGRMWKIIDYD